jgi:AcrR family transcriptional regulator
MELILINGAPRTHFRNVTTCITFASGMELKAPPGRPRNPRLDDALFEAGMRTFLERGYHGTTFAEIARRAGVGTPAIYRRWPRKAVLAMELLERQGGIEPISDTGSLRRDLAEFVRISMRRFSEPLFHQVLLPLLLEAGGDPELARQMQALFRAYREPNLEPRIEKAIAAGELRADTDAGRLVDLLMGGAAAMLLMFSPYPPRENEAQMIVDQLLDGFASRDADAG